MYKKMADLRKRKHDEAWLLKDRQTQYFVDVNLDEAEIK